MQGYLSAFDFFRIVIWKANRAKMKVAKRLLGSAKKSLDEVVVELTKVIGAQKAPKDRMRLLLFGHRPHSFSPANGLCVANPALS